MNSRYVYPMLLLAVVFWACSSEPASNANRFGEIAAIDSLIHQAIDGRHFPGAVIRIQRGDSVLHYKAYGYAHKYTYGMKPLEKPEPMTTGHLFDLASLTKVLATTFGVMQLVDNGDIDLDDPLYAYLPKFDKPEKRKITIRHLLTHSSGLLQWYPLYYHASGSRERYEQIVKMPLKWPVGKDRHYSDLGFMLLGDLIERVSGKPLDAFMREELYEPLELSHTAFNPFRKEFENIAATSHGNPFEKHMVYDDDFGYRVDVDPESWNGWRKYTLKGEVNDGNAWYADRGVAGHAGLFSTAGDIQKMINVLLNKGHAKSRQMISEAVIDTFLTKDQYGNALGWAMDKDVISAAGTPEGTFGHTGFTGTNVLIIPEYGVSVIFLTNRQHSGPGEDGYYFDLGPLRQEIANVVMRNINH